MMKPYSHKLEREIDQLRTRRVGIRRALGLIGRGLTSGDAVDIRRRIEGLRLALRATDLEWSRLHHLAGKELPGAPVSLRLTSADRAALGRQQQTRRTI